MIRKKSSFMFKLLQVPTKKGGTKMKLQLKPSSKAGMLAVLFLLL